MRIFWGYAKITSILGLCLIFGGGGKQEMLELSLCSKKKREYPTPVACALAHLFTEVTNDMR